MNQTAVLNPPKPTAKPRKRKWFFRLLWTTLALVIGAGLSWFWARHAALLERDALIAELHAKGQPVWWNEVVDKALAEEPANSSGPYFREALAALDAVSVQFPPSLSTRRDLREFRRELFEPERPSADVAEALRLAAPATALLEKAVLRKPGLIIANLRDFDGPVWRPHLAVPALVRLINLKTHDALVQNDPKQAYQTVVLALECAKQFRADPIYMGLVAGLAMRTTACECLLECLARLSPPDAEFRAIDQLLSAHDDGFDISPVFIGERARTLELLESDESMRSQLAHWVGWRSSFLRGPDRWMHISWIWALGTPLGAPIRLKTESEFLKVDQRIMPLFDRPSSELETTIDFWKEFLQRSPLHRSVEYSDSLFGHYVSSQKMLRQLHQRLILSRLALRLRCHHDKHDKFPDNLDELCDDAMPKIRLDWFGNHSITYKPSANGFRLELPKAAVPTWEHYHLDKTPIPSEYGLEVELKK